MPITFKNFSKMLKANKKLSKKEKEKAEKAQLLAEAWIGESKTQAGAPSHVPVSSRESSPTLTRLRSALGSTQRDGDDSDRNESTVFFNFFQFFFQFFFNFFSFFF